jgi:phosphoglycerol transferase
MKDHKKSVPGKKKRKPGKVRIIVTFIVSFLFILLGLSGRWGSATWGNLSMDEMLFTLTQNLSGTGQGMIGKYIKSAVVPTVVLLVVMIFVFRFAYKHKRGAMTLNILFLVSCIVVCVWGGGFLHKIDFFDYVLNQGKSSNFIEENYVDPAKTSITFPTKKRNLIYIYMESMEVTSTSKANGGDFSTDLIPELTNLAKTNEDFSGSSTKLNGGYSLPGTTWTMGGLFGQTSGLPLKTDIGQNAMGTQSSFFPNITCLGDILAKQGYNQTFMLGSDASFSGRRTYFKDHGNFSIEDYPVAKKEGEISKNYKVFWGFEDEKLYSFSKTKLTNLASSSKPFNFTMLTVDTHFPSGYKCRLCKNEHNDQYLNAMSCASRQVAAFIKWCQSQSWYKNTTIVINGDHPTMSKSYTNRLDSSYTRKTYTCYINAAAKPATNKRRTFSTLDSFPTTVAALGATIKGNRLGLGTNLFSSVPTLSEKDGYQKETTELKRTSAYLNKLEKMTDVNAAKQVYYNKAAGKGHADKLEVLKRDGNTLTVRITDFLHDKTIAKVNIKASKSKEIANAVTAQLKEVNKEKCIYEGTIDVSSLNSKKLYLEASYVDTEGITWPLARISYTMK